GSIVNDEAAFSIASKYSEEYGAVFGLKIVVTLLRLGAICLRAPTHLVPNDNSNTAKPVILPPGCARLATRPWPTGSVTDRNTMGIERVSCCRATTEGVA